VVIWERDYSLVYRDIEKALDLRRVQIHCLRDPHQKFGPCIDLKETYDKMVAPRALQHVCDKLCGDGRATLVLLVLTRIGEEGDHGGDPPGAGNLACVDHDAEFHERRVDRVTSSLDDVDVIFADRFEDSDRRFTNRVACNRRF
jgi:hypothetical protein